MVGAQEFFCVHLNILDEQKVWDRLEGLYRDLPGWQGFVKGCPLWRMDGGSIQGSVEPGGLQLSGHLPGPVWEDWLERFRREASTLLGYAVGEPEEGFAFPKSVDG